MRVISVNVGLPREITWKGETVFTGIFKEPVEGRVAVRTLNIDGDRQADLTVHGGRKKAVYAYPSEHYSWWRETLGTSDLPPGSFGENLTLEGMLESDIRIGDRFAIGSTEFEVTQPRVPCYKLAAKFARVEIIREFLESGYSGFYFAVVKEGEIGSGDEIVLTGSAPDRFTIAEANRERFKRKYII